MAALVLIGFSTSHLAAGLAASVGAFIVGGVNSSSSLKAQVKALVAMLIPTAVAVIVVALASGCGWRTDATIILLICAAATIGPYSRFMIAATTRFILSMVIMVNFTDSTENPPDFLALLGAGALFTVILNLIFGGLVRAHRRIDQSIYANVPSGTTAAQTFARWKRSLMHLSGWQYALRLALCLGSAAGLRSIWPNHHLYWVSLTAVILSQRNIERFPVKTTQRALGTALGVIVASVVMVNGPADWVVVVSFGLLAVLRPFLRARNYFVYSVVMTPLVIFMMDAGNQVGMGVIVDRLIATFLGAALVITTNLIFGKILTKNA